MNFDNIVRKLIIFFFQKSYKHKIKKLRPPLVFYFLFLKSIFGFQCLNKQKNHAYLVRVFYFLFFKNKKQKNMFFCLKIEKKKHV